MKLGYLTLQTRDSGRFGGELISLIEKGGQPGLQAANVYEEIADGGGSSAYGSDWLTYRSHHLTGSSLHCDHRRTPRYEEEKPIDGEHDSYGDKARLRAAPSTIAREHGTLAEWALVRLGNQHLLERLNFVKDDAGAAHDAGKWVIGNTDRHLCFGREADIHAEQECATAGENYALVHDVCNELWWSLFDGVADSVDYFNDRRFKGFTYLWCSNFNRAR
ncbi:MAG: hypothetical protein RI971_900 [Chloroflexota bacterium]